MLYDVWSAIIREKEESGLTAVDYCKKAQTANVNILLLVWKSKEDWETQYRAETYGFQKSEDGRLAHEEE